MPATCSTCQRETDRYTIRQAAGRRITTCHACNHPQHASPCANPFAALTLTHARDEFDQPVQVSSLRQLRQAEQRYHFKSVIANEDSANFDKPPKTANPDLFAQMSESRSWLYPEVAEPMLAEMREQGEI